MVVKVALIIPTFNEAGNIKKLVELISAKLNEAVGNSYQIVIVDDNSPDGTGKIADRLSKKYNLIAIHRKGKQGLSSAVLAGLEGSSSEIVGVMDADFSHPPEKILEILELIKSGQAGFVLGSRYVKGGKIENWPFFRRLVSFSATLLAKPIVSVSDPMSGFFFFKRSILNGVELNPTGFKIGMEILAKAKPSRVLEVPIVFHNRLHGKSKMSKNVILDYIYHCIKLYFFTFKRFIKFCLVGFTGTIVNTFFLWSLTSVFGVYYIFSGAIAAEIAIFSNFLLNDSWTWRALGKKGLKHKTRRFLLFNFFSLGGLVINVSILFVLTEYFGVYYLLSNFLGIFVAAFWNYYINNKITWGFHKKK